MIYKGTSFERSGRRG